MHNFGRISTILTITVILSACSSDKSIKVTSLQKKDKTLSCQQVMLEINEAEFYRKAAEKNKSPKLKSVLMPIGYVYTYVDAEDAVQSADERVDYLNRIYEILKCDDMDSVNEHTKQANPVIYSPAIGPYQYSRIIPEQEYIRDKYGDEVYW